MREAFTTRELTVAQWRELALLGKAVPVRIRVNGDSMNPLLRRQRDKVCGQRMLTLGDGCLYPDTWMDVGQAWGQATLIERGRLTINTRHPFWRAAGLM